MEIIDRLREEVDWLFGHDDSRPKKTSESTVSYPPVNVREDADYVYAEAELPGHQMQNIDLTVTGDDRLTIKGDRKRPAPEKAKWRLEERGYGVFEKTIELPDSITSDVDARLDNGVLSIRMAKSPRAKPRKIPVNVK